MSDSDYSERLTEAIRQALASRAGSLPQIASRYYQLNDKGTIKECPFCHKKDSTFSVRPATGGHWYWGCYSTKCDAHFENLKANKTGDTIGFIMVQERCDRATAIDKLLDWTGVRNPKHDLAENKEAAAKKKRPGKKTAKKAAASKAADAGTPHAQAKDEPPAREDADENLFDPASLASDPPADPEEGFSLSEPEPPLPREKTVWDDIHERLTLTHADREMLRRKRGFTLPQIERGGFRSSNKENRSRLAPILANWPESLLLKEGIASKDSKTGEIKIAAQLCGLGLEKRADGKNPDKWGWTEPVLIPYFDLDGHVTSIRPHKGGLSGKTWMREHGYEHAFRHTDTRCNPYAARGLWVQSEEWERKCVITEAEFKANALDQHGIPAIGLPGIQMACNEVFREKLVTMLRLARIREVIIVFDNEDKSHKPDPWTRYEADAFARATCHFLHSEGFLTSFTSLPDDWRIDGKADWDGALTLGKTKADFEAVLKKTRWYSPQTELFGKNERERVIQCRLNRLIHKPHILTGGDEEEDLAKLILKTPMPWRMAFRVREMAEELRGTRGCYYVNKPPSAASLRPYMEFRDEVMAELKKTPEDDHERIAEMTAAKAAIDHIFEGRPEILSDFTIQCDYQVRRQDGEVHKLLRFRNKHGQISDYVMATPEQLSTSSKFRTFAMGVGNFNPIIGDRQLQLLMIDLGTFSAWREIRELEHIGEDRESGLWITGDCAFTREGEVIFPDDHNIIWHDGIGYRIDPTDLAAFAHVEPPRFFQALGKEPHEVLKEINDDPAREELIVAKTLVQFAADMISTFGDAAGLLFLGGLLTYPACPELLTKYHAQPGVWMHGRGGAGKSEQSRFAMQMYGFDGGYQSFVLSSTTTAVAIGRVLAQYRNWIAHLDEFRADEADKTRIAALRSPFGRQAAQKGTKEASNKTRSVIPQTSPFVTGEGITNDSATLSRYISVILSAGNRLGTIDEQTARYRRMLAESAHYHRIVRWILMRRKWFGESVVKLLDQFLESDDVGKAVSVDRLRFTYGSAFAVFTLLFDHFHGILSSDSTVLPEGIEPISDADMELVGRTVRDFREFTVSYAASATGDVNSVNFVVKFWNSLMTDFYRPGNSVKNFFKFSFCTIDPVTNKVTETTADRAYPEKGIYACVIAAAGQLYAEYEQSCNQRRQVPELSLDNIRLESQQEKYWVKGPRPKEDDDGKKRSCNRSRRMTFNKEQLVAWVLRLDLMPPSMRQLFESHFEKGDDNQEDLHL